MAVGQVPDGNRDHSPPDIEGLQARVNQLRQSGGPTTELIDAINALAIHLFFDPEQVVVLGTESRDLSREIGYSDGEAWGLGIVGMGLYMYSRLREASDSFIEAERIAAESTDTRLQAAIKTGHASVYLSLGDFERALEYGIRALQLVKQTGNLYDEAWLHHGISTAYADLGDLDRAMEHARKGHVLFSRLYERAAVDRHLVGIGRCLSAEGAALQAKGENLLAEPIQKKALEIFRQTGNQIGEARALNDLGLIECDRGEYKIAEDHHRESLAIRRKINNRQSQSTSLLNLARVFLATDRADDALTILEEALEIAEETGAKVRIYQINEAFADAHESQGNIVKALYHHRLFHTLREEVMGESVTARIKNLQIAFEIERAEHEADLVRQKNEELSETNERLNRLLAELQRAQDRLVQSEKMASLGQLTAGIAHEIKNPLNFVTNFAAMNLELIEDLGQTMSGPSSELNREEIDEITADIADNARRILEHGQRADSIIRGMLLHARGGGGEAGPVEFNAFVDEYVKLAYHGFRAQKPDFNVTIETRYGSLVGTVEVNSSDLGRVILNLANNAFFALDELSSGRPAGFSPTIIVSTIKRDHQVEFRLRDNGPGISEEIRSRIFEPFFTTKAAGEGTGLGLSLSYDIVVQGHGGDMYVESELGTYTEFVVILPTTGDHSAQS